MAINSSRGKISKQDGYTLVESVVAMSLFALVVIGLVSTISSFMYSAKNDTLQGAFILAQIEISKVDNGAQDSQTMQSGKYIVKKVVSNQNGYSEVIVSVSPSDQPDHILVILSKVLEQ